MGELSNIDEEGFASAASIPFGINLPSALTRATMALVFLAML
jgi:hypothetical protein